MIRMPPLPIRQNDHPRPRLTNHARHLQPVLPSILNATVRDVECPPPTHTQNLGSVGGFARAVFRRAARPHLTLRQVEDAGALPALRGFQERTAAGLLDVVAVRGDGQNVESWTQRKGRHVSPDSPARARRSRARSAGAPPFPLTWAAGGLRARRCRRR